MFRWKHQVARSRAMFDRCLVHFWLILDWLFIHCSLSFHCIAARWRGRNSGVYIKRFTNLLRAVSHYTTRVRHYRDHPKRSWNLWWQECNVAWTQECTVIPFLASDTNITDTLFKILLVILSGSLPWQEHNLPQEESWWQECNVAWTQSSGNVRTGPPDDTTRHLQLRRERMIPTNRTTEK